MKNVDYAITSHARTLDIFDTWYIHRTQCNIQIDAKDRSWFLWKSFKKRKETEISKQASWAINEQEWHSVACNETWYKNEWCSFKVVWDLIHEERDLVSRNNWFYFIYFLIIWIIFCSTHVFCVRYLYDVAMRRFGCTLHWTWADSFIQSSDNNWLFSMSWMNNNNVQMFIKRYSARFR